MSHSPFAVHYRGLECAPLTRKAPSGGIRNGEIVNFTLSEELCLPKNFGELDVSCLLHRLQVRGCVSVSPGESAEQTVIAWIRHRAARLSVRVGGRKLLLPGACPVVSSQGVRAEIHDPLSALAVITQSEHGVWLRDREPRLRRIAAIRKDIRFPRRSLRLGSLRLRRRTVHEIALWIPAPVSAP